MSSPSTKRQPSPQNDLQVTFHLQLKVDFLLSDMSNSDVIPEIEFTESDLSDSEDERPILEQLTNRSESEKVRIYLIINSLSIRLDGFSCEKRGNC